MWKWRAPGGALEFFTYSELILWVVLSLIFNPWRWQWIPFVLFGWGRIRSIQSGHRELEKRQEHQKARTKDNRKSEKTSQDVDDSEQPTYAAALGSGVNVAFHNKPLRAKASSSTSRVTPSDQTNDMAENVKVKTVPNDAAIAQHRVAI
jgi:hypothetical protein